jgi:hypothetical protein
VHQVWVCCELPGTSYCQMQEVEYNIHSMIQRVLATRDQLDPTTLNEGPNRYTVSIPIICSTPVTCSAVYIASIHEWLSISLADA